MEEENKRLRELVEKLQGENQQVKQREHEVLEQAKEREQELLEQAKEREKELEQAKEREKELLEQAKEREQEVIEQAKEREKEVLEQAKQREQEVLEQAKEREKEVLEQAKQREQELLEQAKEREKELLEQAKEREQEVLEKNEELEEKVQNLIQENEDMREDVIRYKQKADELWNTIIEEKAKQLASLGLDSKAEDHQPGTIPVGEILAKKPLLRIEQYLPSLLNNELAAELSPTSTKTDKFPQLEAPINIPSVAFWEETSFYAHLNKADDIKWTKKGTTETVSVWEEVNKFKVNDMIAANIAGKNHVARTLKDENQVNFSMLTGVYYTLEFILRSVFELFDLNFTVASRPEGNVVVPSLSGFFRVDLFLQIFQSPTKDNAFRLNSMIIQENKLAFKFPGKVSKNDHNPLELENLYVYYIREKKQPKSNVLKQLRTYMAIYQRRYGIISSLNCFTLVRFTNDDTFEVSERFWINKPPSGIDTYKLCLMEILIKFILMSMVDNSIKRPSFLKKYLSKRFTPDKLAKYEGYDPSKFNDDEDEEEEDTPPPSTTTTTSTTTNQKHTSSSSEGEYPSCWADFEDPRRNAEESDLTIEQELSSLGTLEGDATFIGHSRVGEVYRKEWNGVSIVCKLLALNKEKDKLDPEVKMLQSELLREARVYSFLSSLQGSLIPRFVKYATLIPEVCEVFATEYSGEVATRLSKSQAAQVRSSLKKIHSMGVSHGDLKNARNILIHPVTNHVILIDFGFATFKNEKGVKKKLWKQIVKKDQVELEETLAKLLNHQEENLILQTKRTFSKVSEASDTETNEASDDDRFVEDVKRQRFEEKEVY